MRDNIYISKFTQCVYVYLTQCFVFAIFNIEAIAA